MTLTDVVYAQQRRDRINRVRRRLAKIQPQDQDMVALIGAIKGLVDIIADDGDDYE